MPRKSVLVVALLMAVGCLAAILPAQESSRRKPPAFRSPSAYGVPGQPTPASQPPTAPGPFLPDTVIPSAGESTGGPAAQTARRVRPQSARSQYTPGGITAPPPSSYPPSAPPAAEATAPLAADPAAEEAGLPPIITRPAELPSSDLETPQAQSILKRMNGSDAGNEGSAIASPPAASEPAELPGSRSILKSTQSAVVDDAVAPIITPSMAPNGPSARRTASGNRSSMPANAGRSIQELAVTGRSPALRVDVSGPEGITVGKPANYVISLVNEGETPAQDVQLRVALPGFVSVASGSASSGEAVVQGDKNGAARLLWQAPQVAGQSSETLRLQLIATEGQPFDLQVEWAMRPSTATASILVRQPQLELSLAGPSDMTFGEEKEFTLTVTNPGTGDAENVSISLSASGSRPQQVDVGVVPAGSQREIPVQVVAGQAGELEVRAVASAEGNLRAEAAGKVIVRKAELNIVVQGPDLKFAGSEGAYMVTVSNSGTAAADDVTVSVGIPAGAKYTGGVDGAASAAGSVKWKIANLPVGVDKTFQVNLQLQTAGANLVAAQASAGASITASGEAVTEVEAISDLKLVVNDPRGPQAVGDDAVYEVQVLNRGSQAASNIKIVMQFGQGLEPVSFEGCEARLVPGQVLCSPLAQLGAGEQVTLRIKARADRGGTHQFRVEVTSNESETRLASEGTTRFFSETGRNGAAASTARRPAAGRVVTPGSIQR